MKLTTTLTAILALAASGALAEGKPTPQPKPQTTITQKQYAEFLAWQKQQQAQAQAQQQGQQQGQGQNQGQIANGGAGGAGGSGGSVGDINISGGTSLAASDGTQGLAVNVPGGGFAVYGSTNVSASVQASQELRALGRPDIALGVMMGSFVVKQNLDRAPETTPRPKMRPDTIRDGIGAEPVPMTAIPEHLPQHKGANLRASSLFTVCKQTGANTLRVQLAPGANRGAAIAACKRHLGVE